MERYFHVILLLFANICISSIAFLWEKKSLKIGWFREMLYLRLATMNDGRCPWICGGELREHSITIRILAYILLLPDVLDGILLKIHLQVRLTSIPDSWVALEKVSDAFR